MSYFNIYFNLRGERTLRRYSRPVNLARFDDLHWMTTEKPVWFIAEYLCEIPHISLLTRTMEKNLTRVDRRTLRGRKVRQKKKIFWPCAGKVVPSKMPKGSGNFGLCLVDAPLKEKPWFLFA